MNGMLICLNCTLRKIFASGRHSRIYRELYKNKEVAIKLICQAEEDEILAVELEKQFISEVALMFDRRQGWRSVPVEDFQEVGWVYQLGRKRKEKEKKKKREENKIK